VKYAFFLGCAAPVLSSNYELSTRRVAKRLGIELVDVEDFACCGFPIDPIDHEAAILLAARNLSIAEDLDLNICTICPGCASTLLEANKELRENRELREAVNEKLGKIGREYEGGVDVKNFVTILYEEIGLDRIKDAAKRDLSNLRVAPHYGCHYLKPSYLFNQGEDPEFPTSLDDLISAAGSTPVDYEDKMDCCGGNVFGIDDEVSYSMTSKKLEHVKAAGADALCLICPLCNVMYDRNQRTIERKLDAKYGMPVLFYPQLLGLALGLNEEDLGLKLNRVDTSELLSKI